MPHYHADEEKSRNVVGRRIAALRKQKKLSLTDFAAALSRYGVELGRTAVYKWEKGESIPNAYQLLAICQAMDVEDELPYFMERCKRASLNAEGQQKLSAYRDDLIASGRYRYIEEPEDVRYIELPVSALAASAGTGSCRWTRSSASATVWGSRLASSSVRAAKRTGRWHESVPASDERFLLSPCAARRPAAGPTP